MTVASEGAGSGSDDRVPSSDGGDVPPASTDHLPEPVEPLDERSGSAVLDVARPVARRLLAFGAVAAFPWFLGRTYEYWSPHLELEAPWRGFVLELATAAAEVALALFLAQLLGLTKTQLGFIRPKPVDLLIGLAVIAAAELIYQAQFFALELHRPSPPPEAPRGALDTALYDVVLGVVAPLREEIGYRALPLAGFALLPQRYFMALVAIFAYAWPYHAPGTPSWFLAWGVASSLAFIARPSLWPIVVAHAAHNFWAYG